MQTTLAAMSIEPDAVDPTDQREAKPVDPPVSNLRERVLAAAPHTSSPASLPEDVAGLLATSERAYERKQREMLQGEERYYRDRAALIESYRSKLRALEVEADEAIRKFDNERAKVHAEQTRMLDLLAIMRDA